MKKKLIYVNLLSADNNKLAEFYEDVVGLEAVDKESNPSDVNWYGFNTGEVGFAIEPLSNREKYSFDGYNEKNPYLIQFEADSLEDLEGWTKDLENKGVKIGQRVLKKSYGTVTTFIDPDGNLVEILFGGNQS